MEREYRDPNFYTNEIRNNIEIVSVVKANTLPTLEEVREIYEVHSFSDGYIAIFNTKTNQYIKPRIGNKYSPYFRYGLVTNDNVTLTVYMHRLVGFLMLDGWSQDKVIDHLDGDKLNNLKDNLEWVTPKENAKRSLESMERFIRVNKNRLKKSQSSSKGRNGLTYKQVEIVFKMFENGFTQTLIAEKFGVSQACISQILTGKRWETHPYRLSFFNNPRQFAL